MIRIENLTVFPDRREVFVDGVRVELGCRAMDVLLVLIEANGGLVTKGKLIDLVWPDTVVAENNLRVHICMIRKMMGDHRKLLISVPGRGYRLLRPVQPAYFISTLAVHSDSTRSAR
jgi:DNA-binding winged helix-turn-helix (wHTH) protein